MTFENPPETQSIQLNADGPLDSEMMSLIRAALRRAREGGITRFFDGDSCIAEIIPVYRTTIRTTGTFRQELDVLINEFSRENTSNTPDYLLANYLDSCLNAFEETIRLRDRWYGVHLEPGNSHFTENVVPPSSDYYRRTEEATDAAIPTDSAGPTTPESGQSPT